MATLLAEAEGEGEMGMTMVAEVILRRTELKKYSAGNVISTCLFPYQFSAWNTPSPRRWQCLDRVNVADIARGDGPFRDPAVARAWSALSAATAGTVHAARATHYFSTLDRAIRDGPHRDLDGVPCPNWAAGKRAVAVHRNHRFYVAD